MPDIPPTSGDIQNDKSRFLDILHLQPQLAQVFAQAPVAMCLLEGSNFRVSLVNDAMLKIWQAKRQDVLHLSLFETMPESNLNGFPEILRSVLQTGESVRISEMPLERERNGNAQKIYVKASFEPFRNESGDIVGVLSVADDITDAVLTKKRAQANEVRHNLALAAGNMASFEWIFDINRFLYSPRLTQIFGLPNYQDFDQAMFLSMIHADDLPVRERAVRRAMKTGKLVYEARIVLPDASVKWIRLNGMVEREDKKPIRMFGMVVDVTIEKQHASVLEELVRKRTRSLERKNRELEASELRYQRMTEEIQDYAILLLGIDGTIMNWNRGAEKIKGYQEHEIIGKKISVFYLPEDQENKLPERLIGDAARHGRAVHEGFRIRKDGTKFWGSITITAIHDTDGSVIGFSKVTRDLTERKLAEDQLRKYTAELEFQNRELEQFAYVASHDLQEPLRKIRMFTGMLGANLENPEQAAKYFEKIDSSAARMSDLIQSVLNYSRLIKTDTEFGEVNLARIVSDVLFDFELMIEEKQADVTVGKMPLISANALQMHQLFFNLIGNALKFCSKQPKIKISASRSVLPEEVLEKGNFTPGAVYHKICVTDNGIGFEQQYADQIFTIFRRLNHKLDYQGTGIGLALCKKIADNHRGIITAQSIPGAGSKFCIYLP